MPPSTISRSKPSTSISSSKKCGPHHSASRSGIHPMAHGFRPSRCSVSTPSVAVNVAAASRSVSATNTCKELSKVIADDAAAADAAAATDFATVAVVTATADITAVAVVGAAAIAGVAGFVTPALSQLTTNTYKELSKVFSTNNLSEKPQSPKTDPHTPTSIPERPILNVGSSSSRPEVAGWVSFVGCGASGPRGRYRKKMTMPQGYGRFSDVWICDAVFEDHSTRVVAVKELRAVGIAAGTQESDSTVYWRMLKRLVRESHIWSSLNHPHIVPLIGHQFHPTMCILSPWYGHGHVMKYLQQFPNADRRKLVRQVTEGILYLHSRPKPVVHGDLKPDNILITDSGDAVISDFGLIQVIADVSPHYSSTSYRAGNPRWLAPELYSDEEVGRSTASDIYAFGSVALEIMTGVFPYRKLNDIQVLTAIVKEQPPVCNKAEYPELPPDDPLWPILFDCWRFEPSERPTIQDLHSRVQAIH
ncbi:hypothetical protein FRC02_001153 [Tulasnella sp. 418]|nr:hypothetical protein FRC02_001153 [Tulasnella sp. 418]